MFFLTFFQTKTDSVTDMLACIYEILTRIAIFVNHMKLELATSRNTEERNHILQQLRLLEYGGIYNG